MNARVAYQTGNAGTEIGEGGKHNEGIGHGAEAFEGDEGDEDEQDTRYGQRSTGSFEGHNDVDLVWCEWCVDYSVLITGRGIMVVVGRRHADQLAGPSARRAQQATATDDLGRPRLRDGGS